MDATLRRVYSQERVTNQSIQSKLTVWTTRQTPAASTLFNVRDTTKATDEASGYFRTFVAKLLYLAKRVRPECLVAVAFLTTRVNDVDIDDIAKLHRLLGYLRASQHRGIVLRIGDNMIVRVWILEGIPTQRHRAPDWR